MRLPFGQRACFVAGSAKSGTTLLVALLDGHPELLPIPEETAYFPTVRRKYGRATRARQAEYLMEEAETRLLFEREAVDRGNRDYRAFPREALRREFWARSQDAARAGEDLLALLAESLAVVQGRSLEGIRWWIEKTPANRWCVPELRTVFPHGRLLLTLRDPRGVAAAVWRRGQRQGFRRFSLYLCVKYWVQAARLFWEERNHQLTCGVRFEELLTAPEATLQRVCAFLEIPYRKELLQPTKSGQPWRGNSTGGQAFAGISTAPMTRWKQDLGEAELAFVEGLCGPWMRLLGYTPILEPKPGRGVVWRRYRCETWGGYLKDRRRYLGDVLKGFWKPPPPAS